MAYMKVKDRRRFERKEFRDYIKLSDDKVFVQVEDTLHYWDTEEEAFQEYKLFKESEIRYQKKELPLAAGAEEVIYSATQMLAAERRNKNRLGKLADMPVYSIPYPQIKKIAALKNHIWGL